MWFLDTDNVVRIEGLRNVVTLDYINDATIKGILYKLPVLNPNAVAAANKGAGKVGIPCDGHGLSAGDTIRLERFLSRYYNGAFPLDAGTTGGELVITTTYAAETFTGSEFIYVAIVGKVDDEILFTHEEEMGDGDYVGTIPHDAPLVQDESYVLCITTVKDTEQVLAKIIYRAGYQGL